MKLVANWRPKVSGHLLVIASLLLWVAPAWAGYSDVEMFMSRLASEHPESVRLIEIGESDSGRGITGLEIGSGPTAHLVVATHHGNEYGSTEVAKAVAADLARKPLEGLTVYVVPVLNITGYDSGSRLEKDAQGSKRDPNRDYPGPCGTDGPYHLKSTAALARFVAEKEVATALTFHTYYPAVVYPWGISTKDLSTPYDKEFMELCKIATQWSHYPVGNSSEVIYPADGTFEDYVFWQHGIWGILFELGHSHYPSTSAIQKMIALNVPGVRDMLEKAPRVRAENHDFSGKCDTRLSIFDRRDE